MFFHAPSSVSGSNLMRMLIDELGGPKRVCKYLDVTERTVWRWMAGAPVPRASVLALYWESKYGRSQIFTDQVNEIRLLYRQICILQEQYQKAKDIVTGLRAMHAGSANEPLFEDLPDLIHPAMLTFDADAKLPAPLTARSQETEAPSAPPASRRAAKAMKAFERARTAAR